jgi:zinc protease
VEDAPLSDSAMLVAGNRPTPKAPHAGDAAGRHEPGPTITHKTLDNGLELVVIPDRRAPVVTHMVWYRNGSADDPPGKSGIAHFLEHLMFKGTNNHPQGEFSHLVAELGGQENAFTGHDYTAYFQRVPVEHLATMMAFEADRMTNLVLSDDIVAPERDVVLEERRMRTESDPSAELNEALEAALFTHHPYGTPIIGWMHEIETLDREDALAYYRRFYTPENAILIVAGDVEAGHVEALARQTYGAIPARGEAPKRWRRREPEPRAQRLVTLADPKVEQASLERAFLVPSYRTAEPGEAEALEVAAHLLGSGPTSHLYKKLVLDQKIAVAAGAWYMGTSLDATRLLLYAMPAPDVTIERLDAALDAALHDFTATPVSDAALTRAKTRLIADAVYAQDNQAALARWYGAALATGETIAEIRTWPDRIDAVSAVDVQRVARQWLKRSRGVTGYLLPQQSEAGLENAQVAA